MSNIDILMSQMCSTGKVKDHLMLKGFLIGMQDESCAVTHYNAGINTLYLTIAPKLLSDGTVLSPEYQAKKLKAVLSAAMYGLTIKYRVVVSIQ